MSPDMNLREKRKQESRGRILESAAKHIRSDGLEGASIVPIMKDAGLTHGSFYSHFEDKEQLVNAAFVQALASNRKLWTDKINSAFTLGERFKKLAKRYLNIPHRDDLANSCAIGSLVSEAAKGSSEFKQTFQLEVEKSLKAILNSDKSTDEERQQAIAFFAMCIGGISLSRAVANGDFSEEILNACIANADKITTPIKTE